MKRKVILLNKWEAMACMRNLAELSDLLLNHINENKETPVMVERSEEGIYYHLEEMHPAETQTASGKKRFWIQAFRQAKELKELSDMIMFKEGFRISLECNPEADEMKVIIETELPSSQFDTYEPAQ